MAADVANVHGEDAGASEHELARLKQSFAFCGLEREMLFDGAKWLVKGATGNDHLSQVLEGVEALVETGEFIHDIEQSMHGGKKPASSTPSNEVASKITETEFWECRLDAREGECARDHEVASTAANDEATAVVEEPEASETSAASGYVVVEKEDVVLAVGHFLSVYLASDPRAAGMTPKELQKAIKVGLKEVRSTGVLSSMWGWGKFLYRVSATGMALFQVYTNPWIVRGVLQVAWVAGKYLTSP